MVQGIAEAVCRPGGRGCIARFERWNDEHLELAIAAIRGAQERGAPRRARPGPCSHDVEVQPPTGNEVH
eukprot:11478265-Alexandrium_andersonii.AAC.1